MSSLTEQQVRGREVWFNSTFGGEKFDVMYATCNEKVYRRRLKTTGVHAWQAPSKPAAPRL